jgi:5-methylcytosine-specific restriction endonuclease McrA
MAQWEHLGCGTVHEAGPVPPANCGHCSDRWSRAQAPPGWRRVGTAPRAQPRGQRRRPISAAKRARIYRRDGHRCVACGTGEDLTLDHRLPIAKGGGDDDSNFQTMCAPCNLAKSDSTAVVEIDAIETGSGR